MKPRLPKNLFPWLKILLFISLTTLTIRSYFYTDILALFLTGSKAHALITSDGRLALCLSDLSIDRSHDWPFALYLNRDLETGELAQLLKDNAQHHWQQLGLLIASGQLTQSDWPTLTSYSIVAFPLWLLLLPTAPLAFLSARHLWLQHRRPKQGLCPTCGYDLRATPHQCPECGHKP